MLSLLIAAALAPAPDTLAPPPREPLHARIDRRVAAGFPDYETAAARLAADAEFLRRVTLDLNGTIPTAAETRAFLADGDPDKRRKRIDRLLASPAYARRMAQHFDVTLMERRRDSKVPRAAWEEYLRAAFAENRRYDALVREMLSNDGADAKTRPAAKFYLDRDLEPNLVTRDLGRVFLGVNLQCAQCHDHPLVPDYKQDDFYGILAFLKRSYLFPSSNVANASIAEKVEGETTFVSVFDKAKTEHKTAPRLPGGKAVAEPTPEKGKEYRVKPAANVRPVPTYSRRELLAAAVTAKENTAFARTAVNRLWAMMLGRGLVHPLDMDHPGNPPSHPELLDLLTAEFVAHDFDVKWLLREVALSATYQRSSEVPAGLSEVPADRYLVAALKPLSPEQLAFAVAQAAGPAAEAKAAPSLAAFVRIFGARPGEPEAFEASLDQTLFVKNGAAVRGMLAAKGGNLVDRLAKLSDAGAVADELFVSVLNRPPTADERADVAAALAGAKDRPAALAELAWALLASAEFRFNH